MTIWDKEVGKKLLAEYRKVAISERDNNLYQALRWWADEPEEYGHHTRSAAQMLFGQETFYDVLLNKNLKRQAIIINPEDLTNDEYLRGLSDGYDAAQP